MLEAEMIKISFREGEEQQTNFSLTARLIDEIHVKLYDKEWLYSNVLSVLFC